jgi:hypothetical protein
VDIPSTISILKRQVKEVPWERMHPAFHFNTKFCHLLRSWEQVLPAQSDAFEQWRGLTEKFVACLPERYRARDGESLDEVDPFANLRRVFASNRQGQPEQIPELVERMQDVAERAGLAISRQDHENLVELACSSGLLSRDQESKFFLRSGSQSPRNDLEDMLAEMEVEQAMGLGSVDQMEQGHILAYAPTAGAIETTGEETHLVINGYGGCLCRFPLLQQDSHIIVLQPREHQGTSVTNLAEPIYQTITAAFPGKKVHEAYEYDFDEGKDYISEITLDEHGGAQWSHTASPALRDLIRTHMTSFDLSP